MSTLRRSLSYRLQDRDSSVAGPSASPVASLLKNTSRLLLPLVLLTGCARFHKEQHTYVYVSARQVYLHDRVAAVSNRVGQVTNGEALEVIERGKRFVKVRTPKGEVGWLEGHAIIDDTVFAQFQDLEKKHSADPVVADAQLRDDLYLHVLPGRDTARFLVIPGNTKVHLLARGTVAKTQGTAGQPSVKPKPIVAPPPSAGVAKQRTVPDPSSPAASPLPVSPSVPVPVPMEDWWLVRDSSGHTGWLIAGRLDVDVPDEVAQYSEEQRMVGAYPIAKVTDYDADHVGKGDHKSGKKSANSKAHDNAAGSDKAEDQQTAPVGKEFTEYVTVLSPQHGGLPYDFDQVRVFTWSLNHHRYETAFRLRGVQGYLPVKISQETANGQTMPVFSFAIANGPNVSIDPETGVTRPVNPRTLSFRLEGNLVRRTGLDQAPITPTHDPADPAKPAKSKTKAAVKKKKR